MDILQYGKDALEDTLNSLFPDLEDRLNLIIIKGVDVLARDQPLYYCVYKMLERGIPYEEVLDSTKRLAKELDKFARKCYY